MVNAGVECPSRPDATDPGAVDEVDQVLHDRLVGLGRLLLTAAQSEYTSRP